VSDHSWGRVKELFEGALEREGPARATFLDEGCGGDLALRREVESLVASHAEAAGFLDGAAVGPPVWGDRLVGQYRILGEVGRGGMGTVYRAVRDDDAFKKQVAVKVVRADLASGALTERFFRERQILARLDHPNIARLFDGGATEGGEPYLVMEYVEGRPIDVFCAERTLGTAARLRLFRTVCGAVQYAHQNLVVHRDIKPGNILVTGDAVPKLLDFGIAKLLVGDVTEAPTQTVFPALTPDYASPEQVRAEPVTTASDVYSLGVVLYELLTGQRPYHVRTPAPEEIVRVVCELQPDKPSTAVRRPSTTETSAPTAGARGRLDPQRRHLAGELEGDLDTIVLKALRKEPARRYASVQELADDVGRYLEGRPVLARADTWRYRASKFVRRHKAAATAAVLLLLSLVAGIAATAWQARIAELHRRRAEKRFSEVRTLARSFLFEIHDAIRDLEGATKARETIVRRALEYLDRLAQEAGDDPSLLEELASGYDRVGDVQGNPREANLGDLSGALVSWRKADAIREKLHAGEPKNVGFTIGLARGKCRLASGLVKAGRSREALQRAQEAGALLDGVATLTLGKEPLLGLSRAWTEIGDTLRLGGDTRATIEALEKGLGLAVRARGIDPASTSTSEAVMRVQLAMSDALIQVGRRQEAHGLLAGGHELAEQLSAADPQDAGKKYTLLVLTERLGDILGEMGDFKGSLEMRTKAIGLAEAQAAADLHDARSRFARFVCYYKLGIAQVLNRDWNGAVRSQDRALSLAEVEVAADPGNTWTPHLMAGAHAERGEALERSGALGAALVSYGKALQMDQALADQDPTNAEYAESLADTKTRLARALNTAGKPEEAIRVLKAAQALLEPLAVAERTNTNRKAALAKVWAGLGAASRARGAGGIESASREACAAYERSALIWTEHEALAPLTAPDRAEAASAIRERDLCVSRGLLKAAGGGVPSAAR